MDKAFEKILYGVFYAIGMVIRALFIGLLYLIGYGIWKYKEAHPDIVEMPDALRFEHTLITAGSGWGKTQILQQMILNDLPFIRQGRSVVVIDSQGDMIRKILRLRELAPSPPPPPPPPVVTEETSSSKEPSAAPEVPPRRTLLRRVCQSLLVFFALTAVTLGSYYFIKSLHSSPADEQRYLICTLITTGVIAGILLRIGKLPPFVIEFLTGCLLFFGFGLYVSGVTGNAALGLLLIAATVAGGMLINAFLKWLVTFEYEEQDYSRPADYKGAGAAAPPRPSLAERLVYVDPSDIEHPPALNLFDFGLDRVTGYSALERETLVNGAIAMYEFMFGALLGAELTNRQGVIFRYLARLLMVVPEATIFTLMDFLEKPELARPYLPKLDVSTQRFLTTQFFAGGFDTTREQILSRLWGVLSNPTLARMFSHTKNKLNLFEAMNNGSIILINTNKELLKQEGCELFGRFMVALLSQATQERAAIPEGKRTPCFVYIDEAHDYFDETLELLLNTARKYNVGITLAHQNLAQFHRKLEQTVLASTSTKWAGGNSADDAYQLAKEMNCEVEFIRQLKKEPGKAHFAFYARNKTPVAIDMTVPLGLMESRPKMTSGEQKELLEQNRRRICEPYDKDRIEQRSEADGTFALEEQRAL